ncbi:MAG: hypothetical protein ACRC1K_13800, partial [Planctomycetia bacterium]
MRQAISEVGVVERRGRGGRWTAARRREIEARVMTDKRRRPDGSDDSEPDDDDGSSPDAEAALAEECLYADDLAGAVEHLSAALALEPLHRSSLRFLEQVGRSADAPLALAPLAPEGEATFVGVVAVRAYFLFKQGSVAEGVSLLLQADLAKPQIGFFDWLDDWFDPAGESPAVGRVPTATAALYGSLVHQRFGGDVVDDAAGCVLLDRVVRLVDLVAPDPDVDPMVRFVQVLALRKLRRFDEAISAGRRG